MLRVHGTCLRALGLVFVQVAEVSTGDFCLAWGLCKCLLRAYGVMLETVFIRVIWAEGVCGLMWDFYVKGLGLRGSAIDFVWVGRMTRNPNAYTLHAKHPMP